MASLERVTGWPLVLRYAAIKEGVLLAVGKESAAALQAALERAARPAGQQPGARASAANFSCSLRPIGITRSLLTAMTEPDTLNVLEATQKLNDTPVQVTAGTGSGSGKLRIVVPAPTLKSLADLYLRLLKLGINPAELRFPGTEGAPGDVPAPPPTP